MFNFFAQAGALLKRGVSNVRNFISPVRTSASIAIPPQIQRSTRPLFKPDALPRAEDANLTTQASTTRLSQQKAADTSGFFARVASPFKFVFDKAKTAFSKATAGFRQVPETAPNVLKRETVNAATNLGVVAIRSLADILKTKIATGIGQSGTPVDRRPLVENKSVSTQAGGGTPNFLGGFDFPFLGSLLQPRGSIPSVVDTSGLPETSSIVVQGGDSFPESGSPGDRSNFVVQFLPLIILGGIAFFFFRGRK